MNFILHPSPGFLILHPSPFILHPTMNQCPIHYATMQKSTTYHRSAIDPATTAIAEADTHLVANLQPELRGRHRVAPRDTELWAQGAASLDSLFAPSLWGRLWSAKQFCTDVPCGTVQPMAHFLRRSDAPMISSHRSLHTDAHQSEPLLYRSVLMACKFLSSHLHLASMQCILPVLKV